MPSDETPNQADGIQHLLERVRELQETQERLMRQLGESLDATGRLLKEIQSRREDQAG